MIVRRCWSYLSTLVGALRLIVSILRYLASAGAGWRTLMGIHRSLKIRRYWNMGIRSLHLRMYFQGDAKIGREGDRDDVGVGVIRCVVPAYINGR